jgi:hypothetical protein
MKAFDFEAFKGANNSEDGTKEEQQAREMSKREIASAIQAGDAPRLAGQFNKTLWEFPDITDDVPGFCRALAFDIETTWGTSRDPLPEGNKEKAAGMRNFAQALMHLAERNVDWAVVSGWAASIAETPPDEANDNKAA